MGILPETNSLTSNDLLVVEKDSTGQLNKIKQSNLNVGVATTASVATRANTIDGTDTTAGETGSTSQYSLAFVEAGSSASNGTKTLRYAKNLTLTPETATTPSTHVSSQLKLVSGPVDIGGTVVTPAASQNLVMTANQAHSCTIQSQAFSGGIAPFGGTVSGSMLSLNPDGGSMRLNAQLQVQRVSNNQAGIQAFQEDTNFADPCALLLQNTGSGVAIGSGGLTAGHALQVNGAARFQSSSLFISQVTLLRTAPLFLEAGHPAFNGGVLLPWKITGDGPNYDLFILFNNVLKSFIRESDGAYIKVSDSRRKQNQQPLGNVLDTFMQLTPKTFTMQGVKGVGLIAQEVNEVFDLCAIPPDSNKEDDPDTNPWTLDYNPVAMYHIKATQELKAEVDALKATVALLQQQVASLMAN